MNQETMSQKTSLEGTHLHFVQAAVWLHAMRLASRDDAWERAFDAQRAHAHAWDYSVSGLTLALLDRAADRFMTSEERA